MLVSFIAMIIIFSLGGFPVIAAVIFATVLLLTTFLLGAIAVRVMGETGIEPVSGTSFIVLLMLMGTFLAFGDSLNLSKEQAVLMALVGTTVFGSAISMSGTVVADYKNSLYIGNRPYHISKGNIMGVVPGAVFGAGVAIFLSILLASGKIDLIAPQANAFASFTILLAEGKGDMLALGLGFFLGCFAEWATGMGTSFGLGMYLPTPITFPMLIGGGLRDWWEEKRLKPKVEKAGGDERLRAVMLLVTFMVAAGMLTGEAFFGVESAILAAADETGYDQEYNPDDWTDTNLDEMLEESGLMQYFEIMYGVNNPASPELETDSFEFVIAYAVYRNMQTCPAEMGFDECMQEEKLPCDINSDQVVCEETYSMKAWWPYARMVGFITVNVVLALLIWVLFRKAGIIGPKSRTVDAEFAE
jgi:uncharacterized oligopeptide transporter (OPT) family protein